MRNVSVWTDALGEISRNQIRGGDPDLFMSLAILGESAQTVSNRRKVEKATHLICRLLMASCNFFDAFSKGLVSISLVMSPPFAVSTNDHPHQATSPNMANDAFSRLSL